LGRQHLRETLRLRDWGKAQDVIREWEADGRRGDGAEQPVTIMRACAQFLRDARARELKPPTLYKYVVLFRRLRAFAERCGLRFLSELTVEEMRAFRAAWPDHNLAALKNLERLRAFMRFCQDSDWLQDNPARKLKNPKVTQSPTLPLSREQVGAILGACTDYPDRANAVRLRAFVLLLRYGGLRIRDVTTLRRDRIDADGKLFLYTAKTGTPVRLPLPAVVTDALKAIPLSSGAEYFFWSGESKPKSAVGDWQRALRRLFKLAGVSDAHAHRFRDTFAVELLLAGVPLERVSILLGHQSVKVTEKHYAPWVSARQDQLEHDVRRTWDTDLLILDSGNRTRNVHSAKRPN
jgi:integrase